MSAMPDGGLSEAPRDPIPAYYRISQVLRRRIAAGVYPTDSQIPTEDLLLAEFGVSRHTIRAAVQLLVAQGLVRRQAGKGTFVLRPAPNGRWAAQSLEDIIDNNFGDRLRRAKMRLLLAGSADEAAAMHALGTVERVARFSWLRSGQEGPYSLAQVDVPQTYTTRLPPDWAARLQTTRLLHLIEQGHAVRAHRVRQLSTARAADAAVARQLEVLPGTPLLLLERTYFDASGRAIEHSKILGRHDRCQSVVELFRTDG